MLLHQSAHKDILSQVLWSQVAPGFLDVAHNRGLKLPKIIFTKLCLYIMLLISDSYQARNGNGMMFGINGFKPPGINEFNGFKQSGMNEFKSNPMARMPLRSSLSSPVGDLGDYMQIRYFLLLFHCNTCQSPAIFTVFPYHRILWSNSMRSISILKALF